MQKVLGSSRAQFKRYEVFQINDPERNPSLVSDHGLIQTLRFERRRSRNKLEFQALHHEVLTTDSGATLLEKVVDRPVVNQTALTRNKRQHVHVNRIDRFGM